MLYFPQLISLLEKYPDMKWVMSGLSVDLDAKHYRCSVALVNRKGVIISSDKKVPALIGEKRIKFLTPDNAMKFVCSKPNPLLKTPQGIKFGVLVCHEHTLPNIWSIRKINNFSNIAAQVCLSNMIWTGYSKLERLQSRRSRILLAIRYRKPFLFVANGGSELIFPCGRIKKSLSPESTGAIFHLPISK